MKFFQQVLLTLGNERINVTLNVWVFGEICNKIDTLFRLV